MQVFPEFKAKKYTIANEVKSEPYIWNSSIVGDEMCIVSLKQLKEENKATTDF